MSWRATDWAWKNPTVTGLAKYVLLALADYADAKTDDCYPSLDELAKTTGLSVSTVRRCLRELEAAGAIKADVSTGGRRRRSHYLLLTQTVSQRPGLETSETPPDRPRKAPTTQSDRPGKAPRNPVTQTQNPVTVTDVVPKTSQEPRAGASAAHADEQAALVETPPVVSPKSSETKIAQAITKSYQERVPLSRFPAIMMIVRKAIQAGYGAEATLAALLRLADEGRSVTVETLRIELEGLPLPRNGRGPDRRPVESIPDSQINPDAILGPDTWQPPNPPVEVDEGPVAARREWFRQAHAARRVERVARAREVLASRQSAGAS